ncbi:MAG: MBL fold metallo-hydrolase [Vulcanibacillus sp.]
MRVVALFENRTISEELIAKHGLSLFIETENHRILFDTGVDDSFIKNAFKLEVNLSEVDTLVISHGHYDHGGGLEAFMEINKKAKIYISDKAFEDYYSKSRSFFKRYIGLDKKLKNSDRLIFVKDEFQVDEGIKIFGAVRGKRLIPKGNNKLYKRAMDGKLIIDNFEHEINLLISEGERNILFCGCAHNGIVNIIDKAVEITGRKISTVIGGMHLMSLDPEGKEDQAYLDILSQELNGFNVGEYYTCHCTGEIAYNYLKQKITKLYDIKTGMVIEV